MRIIPYNETFLEKSAQLFAKEYSDESDNRIWTVEKSKEYLERDTKNYPEYCFIAVDDNDSYIGGIFCRLDPYYNGYLLFVDSLQVVESWRKKGVAKELFKKVAHVAKQSHINGIHLLADGREGFPRSWYQKMGFKETGWIEYEVNFSELKLDD
jgi:N-acetylglutamate synthase-like GNAT family acetyltransferase